MTVAYLRTRADLEAATARTATVLADPSASSLDRMQAAEAEEAVLTAYLHCPEAEAELEAGIG